MLNEEKILSIDLYFFLKSHISSNILVRVANRE